MARFNTVNRFRQRFERSAGTFAVRPVSNSSFSPLWRKVLIRKMNVTRGATFVNRRATTASLRLRVEADSPAGSKDELFSLTALYVACYDHRSCSTLKTLHLPSTPPAAFVSK